MPCLTTLQAVISLQKVRSQPSGCCWFAGVTCESRPVCLFSSLRVVPNNLQLGILFAFITSCIFIGRVLENVKNVNKFCIFFSLLPINLYNAGSANRNMEEESEYKMNISIYLNFLLSFYLIWFKSLVPRWAR